jgi:2-C-methyl-D-erythritol 2,4-cyclodiphosphate synthase
MREVMAQVLEIPVDRISVKATTCERLGAIGRGEGLAVQAVVLMMAHA